MYDVLIKKKLNRVLESQKDDPCLEASQVGFGLLRCFGSVWISFSLTPKTMEPGQHKPRGLSSLEVKTLVLVQSWVFVV